MPFTVINRECNLNTSPQSIQQVPFLPAFSTQLLYRTPIASPLPEIEAGRVIKQENPETSTLEEQLPQELQQDALIQEIAETASPSLEEQVLSLNLQQYPVSQQASDIISLLPEEQGSPKLHDVSIQEIPSAHVDQNKHSSLHPGEITPPTLAIHEDFDYELAISELLNEQSPQDGEITLSELAKSIRYVAVRFISQSQERMQKNTLKDISNIGVLLTRFHSLYEMGEIQMLREIKAQAIIMMIAQPKNHFPKKYQKIADALYHIFQFTPELDTERSSKSPPGSIGQKIITKRKTNNTQEDSRRAHEVVSKKRERQWQVTQALSGQAEGKISEVLGMKRAGKSSKTSLDVQSYPSAPRFSTEIDDESPMSKKRKTATKGIEEVKRLVRAPDDHPIYGLEGIMHHIMVNMDRMISYAIDPVYKATKKSAHVVGHNGFQIGQCWPLQIALLRDGGHGERMAGICGNLEEGAFSIVVGSEKYELVDDDSGHELYYSAPSGYDGTKGKANKRIAGAKFLLRSIATRNAVRVFRNKKGSWAYTPRTGLRYDGLYQVMSVEDKKNDKGNMYASFYLVRLRGQAPIATSNPTDAEVAKFEKVKEGY